MADQQNQSKNEPQDVDGDQKKSPNIGGDPNVERFNVVPNHSIEMQTVFTESQSNTRGRGRIYSTSFNIPRKKRREKIIENAKATETEKVPLLSRIVKDERRQVLCKVSRFLLIGAILAAYFSYQLSKYLDPTSNTYTSSSLTKITSLGAPYLIFEAVSHKIEPYFEYVYMGNTGELIWFKNMSIVWLVDDSSLAPLDAYWTPLDAYRYDPDTPNWTLIEVYRRLNNSLSWTETNERFTSIVIPPKDRVVTLQNPMEIALIAASNQVNTTNNVDDKAEYVHSFAEGYSYGIYWMADSREEFVLKGLDSPVEYLLGRFGNSSNYAFSGQVSVVYLDEFETIDERTTDNDGEEFYVSRVGSSLIDYDYTMTDTYCNTEIQTNGIYSNGTYTNGSLICVEPSFWTFFYVLPNPSGIKTTILIANLRDFFDILASVGGIFSPLLEISALFILYCIYGMDLGFVHFRGLAPYSGFNDAIFEKKLDVYLAERGLIIMEKNENQETNLAVPMESCCLCCLEN